MAKLTGKAKQKARKKAKMAGFNLTEAEAIKNAKNGIPNLFGGQNHFKTGIVFTTHDELAKLVKMTTGDIVPYNTKSNVVDFNAMGFVEEGGFFIALLPRSANGLVACEPNQNKVLKALENFKLVNVSEHWMMASCYCSKDRVLGHQDDICNNVKFAFVGYSQPHKICTLAEDRELCVALRDRKNPLKQLNFEETA